MKIELNTEKASFCTIGQHIFTFADSIKEIDEQSLPDELKKQILYNLKRGILSSSDADIIAKLSPAESHAKYISAEERPISPQQVQQEVGASPLDPLEEDLKSLRALLKGSVASIKKTAKDFRVARLRKLMELEEKGKSRKGLLQFLDQQVLAHATQVSSTLNEAAKINSDNIDIPEHASPHVRGHLTMNDYLANVSDVVESEEEELVLSQEVLNQLGE